MMVGDRHQSMVAVAVFTVFMALICIGSKWLESLARRSLNAVVGASLSCCSALHSAALGAAL